jgi:hypothetical protein
MSNIAKRLDVHFAALAAVGAVAGVGGTAQNAHAAIVYSGSLNTPIIADFSGIYLNLVTGATARDSSLAGWDINPWVSGGSWRVFPNGASASGVVVGASGVASDLLPGTLIDGASTYITGSSNTVARTYNPGPGILGIRFIRESDNAVLFGWIRMNLPGGSSATAGTIVDYAYEDTGAAINAGAVPAPTAGMGLLAMGGLGLLGRRRK